MRQDLLHKLRQHTEAQKALFDDFTRLTSPEDHVMARELMQNMHELLHQVDRMDKWICPSDTEDDASVVERQVSARIGKSKMSSVVCTVDDVIRADSDDDARIVSKDSSAVGASIEENAYMGYEADPRWLLSSDTRTDIPYDREPLMDTNSRHRLPAPM